jgi:hypothetical protein
VAFGGPEAGEKSSLVAVVGAANGTAEEYEPAVILASAEHLARVPRKRRAVKRNEYEPHLGARNQQGRIVEAQPRPVLPGRDVNDGKPGDKLPAG